MFKNKNESESIIKSFFLSIIIVCAAQLGAGRQFHYKDFKYF
jgi:hypothetical protein